MLPTTGKEFVFETDIEGMGEVGEGRIRGIVRTGSEVEELCGLWELFLGELDVDEGGKGLELESEVALEMIVGRPAREA